MRKALMTLVVVVSMVEFALAGPKIILMIPDGMSFAALTAARIVSVGVTGRLNMDLLPVQGRMSTYSADSMITDSAAAGTALATGQKTDNGVISQDPSAVRGQLHGAPLKTILEWAEELGLATGLVTTTRVTHATPAAFYAHWYERDDENTVAEQFISRGDIEVLLGGGRRHWLPQGALDPETGAPSKRADERDLIAEAQDLGYTYVWDHQGFQAVDPTATNRLLGLFEYSHMDYELDRAEDEAGEPSLAEMTRLAIQLLDQDPDGFFLMVEGGRIDHAAHANDAGRMIWEVIAFDLAVGVAREFAQKGDVLLIVAPDHGTGGPEVIGVQNPDGTVTTYGGFCGYEDADGDGYPDGVTRPVALGWASSQFFLTGGASLSPGGEHTGGDVPVMAMGPGSELLDGFVDNTEVFWAMASLLGIAP